MEFFLSVLGVLLIIEGIPWFLSPMAMKKMLLQLLPMPEATLRILGAMLMFSGLLLVYFATA